MERSKRPNHEEIIPSREEKEKEKPFDAIIVYGKGPVPNAFNDKRPGTISKKFKEEWPLMQQENCTNRVRFKK